MREPGGLEELDARARSVWTDVVTSCIRRAVAGAPGSRLTPSLSDPDAAIAAVDWVGYPARVEMCIGRSTALSVLDSLASAGDASGPRPLQEEYLEWRVVREADAIVRVEMTTELPEYWAILAAHAPRRALMLVSSFARRPVSAEEIYGSAELADVDVPPKDRGRAFAESMLDRSRPNPLNDGREAICFMQHEDNNLEALARLAGPAAMPLLVGENGAGIRYPTAPESIAALELPAFAGRMSDPVLVERLGRLALEGREIALDDPVGIYIQGVEHSRIRAPNGSRAEPSWFALSRGLGSGEAPDRRPRYQRLVLELPEGLGFTLDELRDAATGRPIVAGAQVADLVQLAVLFRVSAPAGTEPIRLPVPAPATVRCGEIRRLADALAGDAR